MHERRVVTCGAHLPPRLSNLTFCAPIQVKGGGWRLAAVQVAGVVQTADAVSGFPVRFDDCLRQFGNLSFGQVSGRDHFQRAGSGALLDEWNEPAWHRLVQHPFRFLRQPFRLFAGVQVTIFVVPCDAVTVRLD